MTNLTLQHSCNIVVMSLLLILVSCDDGDNQNDNSNYCISESSSSQLETVTVPLGGMCDPEERLGGFQATIYSTMSEVKGAVLDGIVPLSVLTVIEEDGDCRLVKPPTFICDPTCSAGHVCNAEGVCTPEPRRQGVGTVEITGLHEGARMEPVTPTNTYFVTDVPHPPFEAGDLIQLKICDGPLAPIGMNGIGVDPLIVEGQPWTVKRNTPLSISWNGAGEEARTTVFVEILTDLHGALPPAIHCEFDDTGSGTVSSELINSLLDQGMSGMPAGRAIRRTADKVSIPNGCLDFQVSSSIRVSVEVER